MSRPGRRRAGTVAAVVAAVVVMGAGVALLATAWRTQRDAVAAAGLVARGQAGVWYDALAGELADGKAPSHGQLEAFVAANADDGLRAVIVVGGKGEVLADGGAPLRTVRARDLAASGEVVEVGDRVRVVLTGPVRVRRNQARRQNPPQALRVVIEFVDDAGRDLRASARRTLWIGGATAAGCFVAAGLLLAWWRRRDRATAAAAHAQRLASLGQMSATMAHELRNPLASLKGNAQLLARMLPEGEKPRGKADLVVSEAMRLEALTGELLEFARTGAIERTPVTTDELLADVTAAVGADAMVIDRRAAPSSWRIDRARLGRALTNLVRNGREAAGGRAVELSVAQVGRELRITVRDHGPGVPAADRERIFEPFFTKRTAGTGLGLAVVHQVVELHGGQVAVDDAPGGGARFTMRLPA